MIPIKSSDREIIDVQVEFLSSYRVLRDKINADSDYENDILHQMVALRDRIADLGERYGESATLLALRQGARRAIASLLFRAPGLSESTKQILREFQEEQPEFVDSRYRFTEDYSGSYRDHWPRLFKRYAGKPGLFFVEIGSFEGKSACWFLENILTDASSRLLCIDSFIQSQELSHGLSIDTYIDSGDRSTFDRFVLNLRLTGRINQVTIIKDTSYRALRTLPPASIDVAYIDGSHRAADVMQDAVLLWGAVKAKGLMIFDDYNWKDPYEDGPQWNPKEGIDAFLHLFGTQLKMLHKGEQVVISKIV
jgi:hypothetical protein